MAKQIGPNYRVGNYGGLCWYKMDGEYYVRKQSAIHYFKKAKRYWATMASAERLSAASKIASVIYQALPVHWKQYWMFRAFTGEAALLMKHEKTAAETLEFLWQRYAAEFAPGYDEAENFRHKPCVEKIKKNKDVVTGSGKPVFRYSRGLAHGWSRIGWIATDRGLSSIKGKEKHCVHDRAGPVVYGNP